MLQFLDIMSIIGGGFEIIGIMLMANLYLKTFEINIPKPVYTILVLASALVEGKKAQAAIGAAEILSENMMISLRGLAFIGLGFILQMLSGLGRLVFECQL